MRVSSLVKNTELRPGDVFSYHSEFYMKISPIYYSCSCSNDEFESKANAIKLSNGELSLFAESAQRNQNLIGGNLNMKKILSDEKETLYICEQCGRIHSLPEEIFHIKRIEMCNECAHISLIHEAVYKDRARCVHSFYVSVDGRTPR